MTTQSCQHPQLLSLIVRRNKRLKEQILKTFQKRIKNGTNSKSFNRMERLDIHAMEYYLALKRNKLMCASTRVNLKIFC